VDLAGAMPIHGNGLVGSVLPGSKNRAKGQRVVREPGRPGLSPCALFRHWGPDHEPQARGWVSWTVGSKRQAQRRVSPSDGNGARREGHRESHSAIVPLKLGNSPRRTQGREGRCRRADPAGGTRGSTPRLYSLSPSPRWIAFGVLGRPLWRCYGRAANPLVDEPYASQGTELWTSHEVFG